MDRLARNLDDLRRMVQQLTGRGVRIEFVKESLAFTGEDSPMANLLLSVMGAFAEFERALIRERQREGISAKQRGVYRGRKKALSDSRLEELRRRVEAREPKAALAREFGISRATPSMSICGLRHSEYNLIPGREKLPIQGRASNPPPQCHVRPASSFAGRNRAWRAPSVARTRGVVRPQVHHLMHNNVFGDVLGQQDGFPVEIQHLRALSA